MSNETSKPLPNPLEKERTIRVILADDHEVVLDGHAKWLSDHERFKVVGKGRTVEEAVELCGLHQPDVAVVDLRYFDRDRPEICQLIKEISPGTRVAMYSAFSSAEQVSAAFQAGANGYFDKHAEGAFLPRVVEQLMRGEAVLDPHIMASIKRFLGRTKTGSDLMRLIEEWRIEAERREAERALASLGERERGIVRDLAEIGIQVKYDAVAERFGFKSGDGLKDALYRIRRLLGVKTNEELIVLWSKTRLPDENRP